MFQSTARKKVVKSKSSNTLPINKTRENPDIIHLEWPGPYKVWLQWVDLRKLKAAKYNPEGRNVKRIKNLAASIMSIGMMSMIVTTPTGSIIIGHRRRMALLSGGVDFAWVMVTTCPPKKAFSGEPGQVVKHSVQDLLNTWLKDPEATDYKVERIFDRYKANYGMKLLKHLDEEKVSYHFIRVAEKAAAYCNIASKKFVVRLVMWMVSHSGQRDALRTWMKEGRSKSDILVAVENNEPLTRGCTN